jgi:hypothetical protein
MSAGPTLQRLSPPTISNRGNASIIPHSHSPRWLFGIPISGRVLGAGDLNSSASNLKRGDKLRNVWLDPNDRLALTLMVAERGGYARCQYWQGDQEGQPDQERHCIEQCRPKGSCGGHM